MVKSLSPTEKEEWKKRLEEQAKSGQSMIAWCQANGTSVNQFYYWRKKLILRPISRSEFFELTSPSRKGLKIECKGVTIELEPHFDEITLKRCLALLQELSC